MSGIDAVISASRRPGEFSERRQFTVSRSRGIQKMRRFALADPHFYILELIQSAVANQARYIDIQVDREQCTCAYIGGGLREHELAQLFDFLFASKDRSDIGHVRELALGINSALLFRPESVTIESGDGTLAGTTRMVVHGSHDRVEIGTPRRALAGTYVAIHGLDRKALPGGHARHASRERPVECDVIESRCLAAPVPILVNHEPLFGHSTQRSPGLFGYGKVLAFDEGDLYGTIGHKPSFGDPSFQLLTWGVSIQHKQHDLVGGQRIGGVVCFDRLHKTVDHSGIVEDERLAEMWARLEPYARQLVSGQTDASVYSLCRLDGHPVAPAELREFLRTQPQVVLVPPETASDSPQGRRALAIGRHLEARVLRGSPLHLRAMRALSGGKIRVIQPNLEDDADVRFYAEAPEPTPTRPWLTPPVEVPGLPAWKVAARVAGAVVGQEESMRRASEPLLSMLGGETEATATIFTPERCTLLDALDVSVRVAGRTVWRGPVASAYPGHTLFVDLPDAQVSALRGPVDASPNAPSRVAEVARVMAAHAVPSLVTAFDRALLALRDLDVRPGSAAAAMGLAAVVRSVIVRLRVRDGNPVLDFTQLESPTVDLLELRLLATLEGRTINLRELAAIANEQCGLVYGVVEGVNADVEELDRSRVLALSEAEERQVVMLLGESGYVRIDERDVLASDSGVACRDLAVGLRSFPDFGLLVEGVDPTDWPDSERTRCRRALIDQLVLRFTGVNPPPPPNSGTAESAWAHAQWEECRRQACRQLQWYVCTRPDEHEGVRDLPLFLDVDEVPSTYRQLESAMASSEGLGLYYGHCHGPAALGLLTAAARSGQPPDPRHRPRTLLASAYLHRLLSGRGRVHPAFDFDLSPGEEAATRGTPFAARARIEAPGVRGVVGVPAHGATNGTSRDIVVVLPGRERARALSELAREHGVVGWVRLEDDFEWTDEQLDRLSALVRQACESALDGLLASLSSLPSAAARHHGVGVLLGYAARHLSLHATRPDLVVPRVQNDLVNRVLSLPLFTSRHGGLVSTWRLVRRFCRAVAEGEPEPGACALSELADDASGVAVWLRGILHHDRIVREPGPPVAPTAFEVAPYEPGRPVDGLVLGATLSHWLAALRPDQPTAPTRVNVGPEFDEAITFTSNAVFIDSGTELCRWTRARGSTDPNAIVWLLLASYACINEALEQVTNEHEIEFQRRVVDTLDTTGFHLVRPVMSNLPPQYSPLTRRPRAADRDEEEDTNRDPS